MKIPEAIKKFQFKFFEELRETMDRIVYFGEKGVFIFIKYHLGEEKVSFKSYNTSNTAHQWAHYIDISIPSNLIIERQIETLLTHKNNSLRRVVAGLLQEKIKNT